MPQPRRTPPMVAGRTAPGAARRTHPGQARGLLVWLAALVLSAVAAIAVFSLGGGSSSSSRVVESIFQDDQLLLYAPTPTVVRTLETLKGVGVDRLRLTIEWAYLAPAADSRVRPSGFNARNPADYPAAAWAPYDRIVELARVVGLPVYFTVTAPGPLWAMAKGAPIAKLANHYQPSASDFGQFVAALGTRYDGHYRSTSGPEATARGPLPRVSYWSVWNEPNQPGWLAPQWQPANRPAIPTAPRLYRGYVDAAYAALRDTGHGGDTFLIGELAPEGTELPGTVQPITPMVFLRGLYCVGADYRPLTSGAATALGCPGRGPAAEFVSAHPGLFRATGFAHHPYSFFLAPDKPLTDPNYVPLVSLGRVERGLDAIFAGYGVDRRLPLYLTEYGYETNPPNPFRGTSLRNQSMYLNEAEYMAWSDPRVRALSQFLLEDAAPDRAYRPGSIRYWSTFQTGLEFLGGKPKPSLNSYRLPIFVADPVAAPGGTVRVWGMLRAAPNGTRQHALVQWRPKHGGYRTLETVTTTNPSGFLESSVQVPSSGAVRLSWTSLSGVVLYSRAVGVRVAG